MPHTNTWKDNSVFRKFTGEINPEEILESNFTMYQHSEFNKIKYIINDFTQITGYSIDENHTKIYASTDDIISDTKGHFKIAIVVNQDDHIKLAMSYRDSMKNKFFKCEIFETAEEAQKWGEL